MALPGALATIQPSVILDRYLSDEPVDAIAASYSVTQQALSKYLIKHSLSDWQECQVARALARKEKAEQDMQDLRNGKYVNDKGEDVPIDAVVLACARERLKSAQWDLERVCRRIYGANVELTGKDGKDLIPADDLPTVARRVAFLLRKGVEADDVSDAEVVEPAQLASPATDDAAQ